MNSRRLSLVLPWASALLLLGVVALDTGAGFHANPQPAAARMTCHEAAAAGAAGSVGRGENLGGLPAPIYYGSIAFVLLLSFGIIEWRNKGQRRDAGAAVSNRPRFDLLRVPGVRRVLTHTATRPVLQMIVVVLFVLIIATGLFGNQLPTKNLAPILTWTVWWCGLVLLILFAGKAWCYVCPWDAIAGWAEGLRLWGRKRASLGLGLRWPRLMRNIWPATILFLALTWVELGFGLTMRPRATAWLGLAMLGMAFASAFIFDRKSFCRYGCLVGRISGLYALFSPVEVRATDKGVCRTCTTRSCFHGNEKGDACPTFQFLGTMDQNTYCISCMECVKTCEANNVSVQLRPWGEDLLQHHRPRSDEAYLALLMLALTGFHGLTMTGAWGRMIDWLRAALDVGEPVAFSMGMTAIVVGPVLLYALLVAVSRFAAGVPSASYRDHFVRYAYALLPIALFYHLAHNSEHLLVEGQKLIPLASDPFGYEWNLFGTAGWTAAPLVSMQTLWAVQVALVLVGHIYSLWAARRAAGALFPDARAARRSQLPMLASTILFSLMSLWLLKQPMEMRMSWM